MVIVNENNNEDLNLDISTPTSLFAKCHSQGSVAINFLYLSELEYGAYNSPTLGTHQQALYLCQGQRSVAINFLCLSELKYGAYNSLTQGTHQQATTQ